MKDPTQPLSLPPLNTDNLLHNRRFLVLTKQNHATFGYWDKTTQTFNCEGELTTIVHKDELFAVYNVPETFTTKMTRSEYEAHVMSLIEKDGIEHASKVYAQHGDSHILRCWTENVPYNLCAESMPPLSTGTNE